MPTLEASGTQTATLDTEHTLTTEVGNATFVLVVDTGAMVAGDITILKLKTKVLTGGTSRIAYQARYAGVQSEPQKYSPPVPADIELVATLEQTDGTGRAYPWAVLSL